MVGLGSLQEQLVQAGLATEEQARRPKPSKSASSRPARAKGRGAGGERGKRRPGGEKKTGPGVKPPERQPAPQKPRPPSAKTQARERSELGQRMADLIKGAALNDDEAEIVYNFSEGRHIRRLRLTAEQHPRLLAGELVIAPVGKRHYLIPAQLAAEILEMSPAQRFHRAAGSGDGSSGEPGADPYADHPVPDDLIW